jgi:predicted ribosome quality control (RQC) complex YloA/Tae2 family protein
MKINLQLNKNINFNANLFFDKAKKLKNKIGGIDKIIEKTQLQVDELEKNKNSYIEKREENDLIKINVKKTWYEDKFRYTKTTNNFLFVMGKDSTTNEILIKKHLDNDDLVFHTQVAGSPFGILKNGKKAKDIDKIEVAQFLGCFSSSWKAGFGMSEVFYVEKNQVSLSVKNKEYKEKGSFVISGTKNYLKNLELKIGIGIYFEDFKIDEKSIKIKKVISGSPNYIKNKCSKFVFLVPDLNTNFKMINKTIKKTLNLKIENLSYFIPKDCKIIKK